MKCYTIENAKVTTDIEEFTLEDAEILLKHLNAEEEYPVTKLHVTLTDLGLWDCDYEVEPPKFERIRRITGYLVGTMDRWNDAKRHEEAARVKHL